jgi:hypothetical protein
MTENNCASINTMATEIRYIPNQKTKNDAITAVLVIDVDPIRFIRTEFFMSNKEDPNDTTNTDNIFMTKTFPTILAY